ncbi:MAG: alpha-ketoglutarate decarboxylase [Flavobacteriaceae bacterium]|nr:alpha-ketoglutarate decarboxylase [Flavobacteriaceae bacterium]
MKKPFITRSSVQLLIIFITFFSFTSQSQTEPQKQKSEFWQQVQFGGSFGLSFGSNFFSGSISPSAIYRFDEMFAVGTALNFSYGKEKYVFENIIVGASVLGLFNPIPQLQISAEFEQLSVNRSFDNPIYLDENYWYPGLYLGAGFSTGPVTMGVRFDVLYNEKRSIYANAYNPFVRVYF